MELAFDLAKYCSRNERTGKKEGINEEQKIKLRLTYGNSFPPSEVVNVRLLFTSFMSYHTKEKEQYRSI